MLVVFTSSCSLTTLTRSSKPAKPTESFEFARDVALQLVIAMQILFHFTQGVTLYIDLLSHVGGALIGLGAAQAIKYRARPRDANAKDGSAESKNIMEAMKEKNNHANFVKHK